MSGIDRDALIGMATLDIAQKTAATLVDAQIPARVAVDAILPAVEQAIRAAEQRGRDKAADAVKAACSHGDMHWGDFDPDNCPLCTEKVRLARGGSTDEEQTS